MKMSDIKVTIYADTDILYKLMEKAGEYFINLEANSLLNIDFDRCLEDYVSALLIYNQNIIKVV